MDVYFNVQVWNFFPLHLPFSIVNVDMNLRLVVFLVIYLPGNEIKCISNKHLGAKGKGRPCQNHHTFLRKILKAFVGHQGKMNPYICGSELEKSFIYSSFFQFAFMIGHSFSQDRMSGHHLAHASILQICHASDISRVKIQSTFAIFCRLMISITSEKKL